MPPIRILLPAIALMAACSPQTSAVAQGNGASEAGNEHPFVATVIANFDSPWAMTFLPDGRMLVAEKHGKLQLVSADAKSRTALGGIPAVSSDGQGGLHDVVLHPNFASNRLVYFSYSEANAEGLKGIVLARGTLRDGTAPALTDVQTLFRASEYVSGNGHFSGRIAFSPDGYLFFTNGDRQKMDPSQDIKSTIGKVLRLNDDGTPAAGNPLVARGGHPAVWSYGHRNLLGIAFDADGNLWQQEMGPRHGDELNLVLPAKNYGWPNASYGNHYDGKAIPDHKAGDGYEPPKVWWDPAISPGGLMVYSGKMFPQWKGDIFIGGLSSMALVRVDRDGTNAAKGDQWDMGNRIREVEEGPDGAIWLLEDGAAPAGRLIKLTPKK